MSYLGSAAPEERTKVVECIERRHASEEWKMSKWRDLRTRVRAYQDSPFTHDEIRTCFIRRRLKGPYAWWNYISDTCSEAEVLEALNAIESGVRVKVVSVDLRSPHRHHHYHHHKDRCCCDHHQ